MGCCEECGAELVQSGRGRERRYCSSPCRQRAYRRRHRARVDDLEKRIGVPPTPVMSASRSQAGRRAALERRVLESSQRLSDRVSGDKTFSVPSYPYGSDKAPLERSESVLERLERDLDVIIALLDGGYQLTSTTPVAAKIQLISARIPRSTETRRQRRARERASRKKRR